MFNIPHAAVNHLGRRAAKNKLSQHCSMVQTVFYREKKERDISVRLFQSKSLMILPI